MINLLFVSIAFPPKNDPECIQTAKYFKYLSETADLNIDVVTSTEATLFMPTDESLRMYARAMRQKVEVPVYENKYMNYLLRKLSKQGVDYPDSKFTFHRQWKKVISDLQCKPDVVYSRSNPLSSTIMGYKLHRHYQVPWIIHLSDPWAYSPLHRYGEKALAYHRRWEMLCLNSAEKVCFTSEQTIELYDRAYPEFTDKFEWFPNVYDKADLACNKIVPSKKLKVVFTGGIAADRSPEPILKSLFLLNESNPDQAEKLEVVFAGPTDRQNSAIFERYRSLDFVKHVGGLSYLASLKLQKAAHLLLVIDNPLESAEQAVFFPSKLLDYFLAQRRIVAVTTKGSTTDIIMRQIKGDSFSHNEIEKLRNFFEEAIDAFTVNDTAFFQNNVLPQEYEAEYNAKRLANLILSSCEKSL